MGESFVIDSTLGGGSMARAYSADMRQRVIDRVESGASRREAAEHYEVIPTRRETDSWDSQISGTMIQDGNRGGCHGPRCCGADGLHCRQGSSAGETGEGCGASAAAAGDRGGP